MTLTLAILFGLFLAYANGANDNFKGVATLYGSGTTSYKRALLWATDQKSSFPSCWCSFMAVSIAYFIS
jgi:phosphate/sulfate permease